MKDRSSVPLAGAIETTNEDFLELLRMLAHWLSQPLTSLRGSVEVALMGEPDVEEYRRVLELCLQESHRMAEALETLRDVLEMEGSGQPVQIVSWTREVGKLLEESVLAGRDSGLQIVIDLQENIWVKASPQHLDAATARLIAGAVRAARGKRLVRISLSAGPEAACLEVCEEEIPLEAEAGRSTTSKSPETHVLGGLDRWVARRAIERQGGKLQVSQGSEVCCYTLTLPLAMPEMAGNVLPQ